MKPAPFKYANGTLNYEDHKLTVYTGKANDDKTPMVISCWEPSQEELAEIQRTGRVWLTMLGDVHPPVSVDGISPWRDHETD